MGMTSELSASISLHAPPRGATPMPFMPSSLLARFQFTPLREGRLAGLSEKSGISKFQFTPLREGRPEPAAATRGGTPISIHAPPRGATQTATGADRLPNQFQFTPLREGRRHTLHKPWHGRHFNSRPSARGDY